MNDEKIDIIESSVNCFKELSQEKKMFVLGFMQGILVNQDNRNEKPGGYLGQDRKIKGL